VLTYLRRLPISIRQAIALLNRGETTHETIRYKFSGTTASTSFWVHFARIVKLYAALHLPFSVLYLVPMHVEC